MFKFTHVSKIGKVVEGQANKVWTEFKTPDVEVPVTLDDVRAMLNDPKWIILSKTSHGEGERIEVPLICKLISDSIKLVVNGKATQRARQGESVDFLKVMAEFTSDPRFVVGNPLHTSWMSAMTTGNKEKKAWAEQFLSEQDNR